MSKISVQKLIEDINSTITTKTPCRADEYSVMQAMLNDSTYSVGVYGKGGKIGDYCPREDAMSIVSGVMTKGAKISSSEADKIASEYEFTKQQAECFVNISKQYTLTYLQTGRRLPLGGRETSNVALELRNVPAHTKEYPTKDGNRATAFINEHDVIRTTGSCPAWVKDNK